MNAKTDSSAKENNGVACRGVFAWKQENEGILHRKYKERLTKYCHSSVARMHKIMYNIVLLELVCLKIKINKRVKLLHPAQKR